MISSQGLNWLPPNILSEVTSVTDVDINGSVGKVVVVSGEFATIYVALQLPDGTLSAIQGVIVEGSPFTDVAELEPTLVAMARTFVYSGGAGDGMEADMESTPEMTETMSDEGMLLADMPDNTILFTSGGQINYDASKYLYPDPSLLVETGAFFLYDPVDVSARTSFAVTIFDDMVDTMDDARLFTIPLVQLAGDANFNPDTSLQDIVLADGRTALYYFSEEANIPEEDKGFVQLVFFIELDPSHIMLVQFQGDPTILDDTNRQLIFDDAYAIASSAMMRDGFGTDMSDMPADDGDMVMTEADIPELFCSDIGMSFVRPDTPTAIVSCPANCGSGIVYGTDIYTDDLSICTAAVHAGLITLESGGVVEITYVEGQDEYIASEQNGVSTIGYGAWTGSFSLSLPE